MSSTHVALMRAIAENRVTRDDCNGTRKGLWALYLLDGVEVGMQVRWLRRQGLVDAPMLGPPSITEDGTEWLHEHS